MVVAGFMPAKITLFTDKCVPKFDLGESWGGGGDGGQRVVLLPKCWLW